MNPNLPSWLMKPQSLSKEEIATPDIVIDNFFEKYDLPLFRAQLKEWLVQAPEFILFSDDIEKIIEAEWVLKNRENLEL